MRAAAALDPARGLLVGWAAGGGGRPGRVSVRLDDEPWTELLAAAPIERLGPEALAALGPPPDALCGFEARLPARAEAPRRLTVLDQAGEPILSHEFSAPRAYRRYEQGRAMSDSLSLSIARLSGGVFHGRVEAPGGAEPRLSLRMRGEIVAEARLVPAEEGAWSFSAALPAQHLSDGVAVVEFVAEDGAALAAYPLAAGEALAADLGAEVAALRSELDQLKRAFRAVMAGGVLSRDERPMVVAEVLAHVDNLLEMRDRVTMTDAVELEQDDEEWEIDA